MSDATNPYRDAILQIARILAPEGCEDLVERTFAESDLPDLVEAVRARVVAVGSVADAEPVWLHAIMAPRYWGDSRVNGEEREVPGRWGAVRRIVLALVERRPRGCPRRRWHRLQRAKRMGRLA